MLDPFRAAPAQGTRQRARAEPGCSRACRGSTGSRSPCRASLGPPHRQGGQKQPGAPEFNPCLQLALVFQMRQSLRVFVASGGGAESRPSQSYFQRGGPEPQEVQSRSSTRRAKRMSLRQIAGHRLPSDLDCVRESVARWRVADAGRSAVTLRMVPMPKLEGSGFSCHSRGAGTRSPSLWNWIANVVRLISGSSTTCAPGRKSISTSWPLSLKWNQTRPLCRPEGPRRRQACSASSYAASTSAPNLN